MEVAMSMHEAPGRRQSRGRGGRWVLVFAASLCALASTAPARDQERIGVRVNTGVGSIPGLGYLTSGVAVDQALGRHVAVFAEGQYRCTPDESCRTLAAGVRVGPWSARRLSPYVTVAVGIWSQLPPDSQDAGVQPYVLAGLGLSIRLHRSVTTFAEVRPLQHMALPRDHRSGTIFDNGMPLLLGVRLGF
jgi:hypothetical protein